jgi:hypothetical protein
MENSIKPEEIDTIVCINNKKYVKFYQWVPLNLFPAEAYLYPKILQ